MKKYDYLIIGTGLYGSIFAYEMNKKGKKCLVIDKRNHIGGNIYCENIEEINVHKYGAHIFHTSNKDVWEYINQFCEFNNYINSPIANYKGEIYNLPFNMNTFNKLWGVVTPEEAKAKIEEQKKEFSITEPKNLEEQAISLIGKDIYEKLIKGYTEKQWGRKATELPAFIIKRLPVRFTYDNNYFNDRYQGIPIGGYTRIIEKMLDGIEVKLNTNFFDNREYFENIAEKIVFTGMIDEFYNYKFGKLEYRSLRFETETLDEENYQGNAVVNYTEREITPEEAKAKIEEQKKEFSITEPKNLEEQAISLIGKDIYEKLIKGYTEKQWGRKATELPAFIIKRLPVRFTYDNNYFNDRYQGIPIGGYTRIIEKMLDGIEVKLNTNFFDNREYFENIAEKIVFTGMIDEFYNYKFGKLEYRSLRFETETLDEENYQGNAVVNYTEREIPYTRIIEHKHFEFGKQEKTVITKEYPSEWKEGDEPYYPVNDEKNNKLYEKYRELAKKETNIIFGGRLGEYKYYDMDKVIEKVLKDIKGEK